MNELRHKIKVIVTLPFELLTHQLIPLDPTKCDDRTKKHSLLIRQAFAFKFTGRITFDKITINQTQLKYYKYFHAEL